MESSDYDPFIVRPPLWVRLLTRKNRTPDPDPVYVPPPRRQSRAFSGDPVYLGSVLHNVKLYGVTPGDTVMMEPHAGQD